MTLCSILCAAIIRLYQFYLYRNIVWVPISNIISILDISCMCRIEKNVYDIKLNDMRKFT